MHEVFPMHTETTKRLVREPSRPHHSNRAHHPRQRRIHQNYWRVAFWDN